MNRVLTAEELQALADIPMDTACRVVCMQAVFTAKVHDIEQNVAYGTTRIMFGDIHLESGKLDISGEGHVVLCLTKHNSRVSVKGDTLKYRCGAPKEEIDFILTGGR